VALSAAVEMAAYRIGAEALTNAVRHANPARAVLRLVVEDDVLLLEVVDDGCGGAVERSGGTGLRSMRQRAEEVGATLHVRSNSTGTHLSARLPLAVGLPA
jgi:signal transduction histidine kinase